MINPQIPPSVTHRIEIIVGDITRLSADVIVNAANTSLLGGGGVDGAIHRTAGPELLKECQRIGGCPVGEARLTKGYNLLADYIIHTVGPVWHGGTGNEDELLSQCYVNSLELAESMNLRTIAFPAISTGAYGFPVERACRIAVRETVNYLLQNRGIQKVFFVCFEDTVQAAIHNILTGGTD